MTGYLRVALCAHPLAVYLSISDKIDTFYKDKHFDDTQPNGRLFTMSGKCYITEQVHTAGDSSTCRYTVLLEELIFHHALFEVSKDLKMHYF